MLATLKRQACQLGDDSLGALGFLSLEAQDGLVGVKAGKALPVLIKRGVVMVCESL